MKKNNPFFLPVNHVGLMVWAGVFVLIFLSCGRKTLPVAPDAYIPPVVEKLSAGLEAGVVHLTWLVPDGRVQLKRGLSEVVVFQAYQAASCPDCSLDYKPIARVPASEMTENDQGDLLGFYRRAFDRPGRLVFYVAAYSATGADGPPSDRVEVVCRPEGD